MDSVQDFHEDRAGTDDAADIALADIQAMIDTDERRMHVRAYNHWVSLLHGRPFPSIADLDPASITDFGPHSVLLDFTKGIENPAIVYLGKALREECALDPSITHVAQVPGRSLLSRLTDHYLQIIANQAPIGFEAEFFGTRGFNTLYRGILMPFSAEAKTIDYIYGVINWKELVDRDTETKLRAEVAAALTVVPKSALAAPVWADGPGVGGGRGGDLKPFVPVPAPSPVSAPATPVAYSLGEQLVLAQQGAAAVRAADSRSRATLYRALGRAYAFAAAADANPVEYEALLEAAGIAIQLRAPMTPVVKLVFGATYDKTRLTEYAAVLAHARRIDLAIGTLEAFLEDYPGGIKGVVRAERNARLRVLRHPIDPVAALAGRPTLASVAIDATVAPGAYVVLLACANGGGTLDIVAAIDGHARLTEQVMRRAV